MGEVSLTERRRQTSKASGFAHPLVDAGMPAGAVRAEPIEPHLNGV
jgi:hypothetical protein